MRCEESTVRCSSPQQRVDNSVPPLAYRASAILGIGAFLHWGPAACPTPPQQDHSHAHLRCGKTALPPPFAWLHGLSCLLAARRQPVLWYLSSVPGITWRPLWLRDIARPATIAPTTGHASPTAARIRRTRGVELAPPLAGQRAEVPELEGEGEAPPPVRRPIRVIRR
jgi:hypothetical protein